MRVGSLNGTLKMLSPPLSALFPDNVLLVIMVLELLSSSIRMAPPTAFFAEFPDKVLFSIMTVLWRLRMPPPPTPIRKLFSTLFPDKVLFVIVKWAS